MLERRLVHNDNGVHEKLTWRSLIYGMRYRPIGLVSACQSHQRTMELLTLNFVEVVKLSISRGLVRQQMTHAEDASVLEQAITYSFNNNCQFVRP